MVEDIELHDQEPDIQGRGSIASDGCVLLQYMPKCIYVRLQNCKTSFLAPPAYCSSLQGLFFCGAAYFEKLAIRETER